MTSILEPMGTEIKTIKEVLIADLSQPLNRMTEEQFDGQLLPLATQFLAQGLHVIYMVLLHPSLDRDRHQELIDHWNSPESNVPHGVTILSLDRAFIRSGFGRSGVDRRANQDWARDICVATETQQGNPTCLIFPYRDDFLGLDRIPATRIAPFVFPTIMDGKQNPAYKLLPSNLRFSGGNVLQAGDHVLIGQDAIVRNLSSYELFHKGGPRKEIEVVQERFRRAFPKKKVSFVGGYADLSGGPRVKNSWIKGRVLNTPFGQNSSPFGIFQPTFHLDLSISIGGPDRDAQNYLIFVGDLVILNPKEFSNGEPNLIKKARECLDGIAQKLSTLTINCLPVKVVRIPLVLHYNRLIENIAMISFNSVLIEQGEDQKRVFFPVDCHERTQLANWTPLSDTEWRRLGGYMNEAQATYRKHGFTIVPIRFNWVARAFRSRSALHCYVNVLQRGEPGSDVKCGCETMTAHADMPATADQNPNP